VLRAIVEGARTGSTVVMVAHRDRVVEIGDRVVEVVSDDQGGQVRYASA
jgi:ATP-binding cassette, subfamily C, bacterial CydD